MTSLVVDASVVVCALIDTGDQGEWAESVLASGPLIGPAHLPAEAANIIRRAELAGEIRAETASLAHADLLDLRVELFPYEPLARRIWELRHTITTYDGWYVALAERLAIPLATLDHRLRRAPGSRCEFRHPSG